MRTQRSVLSTGRLTLGLVAAMISIFAALPARAAIDAAAFATDCNNDGTVAVVENLQVIGGIGTITTNCVVTISPRVQLELTQVRLVSGCCSLRFQGGESSALDVGGSTIAMRGILTLVPSSQGDDDYSVVRVTNSVLGSSTDSVLIGGPGSFLTAQVLNSVLRASSYVEVFVSIGAGTGGTVTVADSLLSAGDPPGNDIQIQSGPSATTVALNNKFVTPGTVRITTGAGGSCTSGGNVPNTPCT